MGVRVLLLVNYLVICIVYEPLNVLIVLKDLRALIKNTLHCPIHRMGPIIDFIHSSVHALFILIDPIL